MAKKRNATGTTKGTATLPEDPDPPIDPRGVDPPKPTPQDPRMAANPDFIAIKRRVLVDHYRVGGGTLGDFGKRLKSVKQKLFLTRASRKAPRLSPAVTRVLEQGDPADQEYRAYRYTRDVEIVNEEMGYGEQLTETLWGPRHRDQPTLERVSQRTKTGRQRLGSPKDSPEKASKKAPEKASPKKASKKEAKPPPQNKRAKKTPGKRA